MLTVLETSSFTADAEELFSPEELANLLGTLAANPEIGKRIPSTGGVRKLRVSLETKGKGKRVAARAG